MITGMGARSQPLALIITTAGVNLAGPCYAKRGDVIKILQGSYDAPDVFGCIYTVDDDSDDWTTKAALVKANPNFGVSVSEEFLLAEQRKAIQSAYLQNNFKTKHLNIWCSSSAAFFNMQSLEACIDTVLSVDDFTDEECIVSIDLASKEDIAGQLKMFMREIEGLPHYYAFPRFYLPDEAAYDPKNKHYQGWVNAGLITVTGGSIIDYDAIERDLIEDGRRFQIMEVPYDKWNATQFATRMEAEGFSMIDLPQNVRHLSEPMKELSGLIKGKRFHFDGNPVLKWMFSNVVAKTVSKVASGQKVAPGSVVIPAKVQTAKPTIASVVVSPLAIAGGAGAGTFSALAGSLLPKGKAQNFVVDHPWFTGAAAATAIAAPGALAYGISDLIPQNLLGDRGSSSKAKDPVVASPPGKVKKPKAAARKRGVRSRSRRPSRGSAGHRERKRSRRKPAKRRR